MLSLDHGEFLWWSQRRSIKCPWKSFGSRHRFRFTNDMNCLTNATENYKIKLISHSLRIHQSSSIPELSCLLHEHWWWTSGSNSHWMMNWRKARDGSNARISSCCPVWQLNIQQRSIRLDLVLEHPLILCFWIGVNLTLKTNSVLGITNHISRNCAEDRRIWSKEKYYHEEGIYYCRRRMEGWALSI